MKTTIKTPLIAGAVLGMLSVGVLSGGAIASSFLTGPTDLEAKVSAPEYRTNTSGLTYGSALTAVSPETEPDLILVVATNGKEGYAYKTDLDKATGATASFSSPKEAIAWQEARPSAIEVPVYAADGKSPVGAFVVGGGSAEVVTKE